MNKQEKQGRDFAWFAMIAVFVIAVVLTENLFMSEKDYHKVHYGFIWGGAAIFIIGMGYLSGIFGNKDPKKWRRQRIIVKSVSSWKLKVEFAETLMGCSFPIEKESLTKEHYGILLSEIGAVLMEKGEKSVADQLSRLFQGKCKIIYFPKESCRLC